MKLMPFLPRALRMFALLAASLPLALGSSACSAVADTAPPASASAAPSGPALWRLADEDTVIYLFGTVHALPAGVEWLDGPVSEALARADTLVTEVDTEDAAAIQAGIAARAMLAEGTLRELMEPAEREAYEALMVSLGLPVNAFDPFKPWFAGLNLSLLPLLQAGYDPASGVEAILTAQAPETPRAHLESVEFQVELFDGLSLEDQLAYLSQTVAGAPRMRETLDAMVERWLEGDTHGLAALLNSDMADPRLYDRLLVARNATWADWLAARMDRPGTLFVAVGAGHLAGRGSVQDQLEQRGHPVIRVR